MKLWPFQFNFFGKVYRYDKVSAPLPTGSRRGRKNILRAKRADERETGEFGEQGDRGATLARRGVCSQARSRHKFQIQNGTSSCKS